ncbi:MAG: DUF4192 domain-containing protein [Actinomycetota bacterium]|nr:DUF4192 domain-containing protein [Actinomycetota bacterium]
MTRPAPDRLRVASPGDLADIVPYLLGFHPRESLVALALRRPAREVACTLRLDLPHPDDTAAAADSVAYYLVQARAERAVLLVYANRGEPAGELPHRDLVDAVTHSLAARKVAVVDALQVSDRRWRSYICTDPLCCPAEGTALAPAGSSVVAAAATYAGLVALPSRDSVERSLDPLPPASQAPRLVLDAARAQAAERMADPAGARALRAEWLALLEEALDTGITPPDDRAAQLVLGAADPSVRDACCAWARSGRADAGLRLWIHLARWAVSPYDAAPLFMVGWFAYLDGNATLASMAIARCLRSDPGHRFARLLEQALAGGLDPALVAADVVADAHRSRSRRRRR